MRGGVHLEQLDNLLPTQRQTTIQNIQTTHTEAKWSIQTSDPFAVRQQC